MKKILILLFVCATAGFVASCINDKGHYDYESKESILNLRVRSFNDTPEITGNIVKLVNERLEIKPEVWNGDKLVSDAGDGFYYKWFTIPGLSPEQGLYARDTVTLAAGPDMKNLSYELKMKVDGGKINPGDYQLFYEVWKGDKVVQAAPITLQIIASNTRLSLQWFILKETPEGNTEVDFYNSDPLQNLSEEDRLQSNVLANSPKMTYPGTSEVVLPDTGYDGIPKGKPVGIGYMPIYMNDYPTQSDRNQTRWWFWSKTLVQNQSANWMDYGAMTGDGNQGVLAVVSENDMRVYDIKNQIEIADPSKLFDPNAGVPGRLNDGTLQFKNFTTSDWQSNYTPFGMYYFTWAVLSNPADNTETQIWPTSITPTTAGTLSKYWGANYYMKTVPADNGGTKDERTEYNMHPEFFRNSNSLTIVFDLTSHSFLWTADNVTREYRNFPTNEPADAWYGKVPVPNGMPELRNMEYDLVTAANDQWGPSAGPGSHIAALMKGHADGTKNGQYMLLLPDEGRPEQHTPKGPGTFGLTRTYPFKSKHEIPDGSYNILKEGARLHLHGACKLNLWVAYGNTFYRYMPYTDAELNGQEREYPVLQLPANETIVNFFQYDEFAAGGNLIRLAVLSNSTDGKWHVRVYDVGQTDGSTGMILDNFDVVSGGQPVDGASDFILFEFSGEGKAKKALYTDTAPLWRMFFN